MKTRQLLLLFCTRHQFTIFWILVLSSLVLVVLENIWHWWVMDAQVFERGNCWDSQFLRMALQILLQLWSLHHRRIHLLRCILSALIQVQFETRWTSGSFLAAVLWSFTLLYIGRKIVYLHVIWTTVNMNGLWIIQLVKLLYVGWRLRRG